jgi:hypothetical protein
MLLVARDEQPPVRSEASRPFEAELRSIPRFQMIAGGILWHRLPAAEILKNA